MDRDRDYPIKRGPKPSLTAKNPRKETMIDTMKYYGFDVEVELANNQGTKRTAQMVTVTRIDQSEDGMKAGPRTVFRVKTMREAIKYMQKFALYADAAIENGEIPRLEGDGQIPTVSTNQPNEAGPSRVAATEANLGHSLAPKKTQLLDTDVVDATAEEMENVNPTPNDDVVLDGVRANDNMEENTKETLLPVVVAAVSDHREIVGDENLVEMPTEEYMDESDIPVIGGHLVSLNGGNDLPPRLQNAQVVFQPIMSGPVVLHESEPIYTGGYISSIPTNQLAVMPAMHVTASTGDMMTEINNISNNVAYFQGGDTYNQGGDTYNQQNNQYNQYNQQTHVDQSQHLTQVDQSTVNQNLTQNFQNNLVQNVGADPTAVAAALDVVVAGLGDNSQLLQVALQTFGTYLEEQSKLNLAMGPVAMTNLAHEIAQSVMKGQDNIAKALNDMTAAQVQATRQIVDGSEPAPAANTLSAHVPPPMPPVMPVPAELEVASTPTELGVAPVTPPTPNEGPKSRVDVIMEQVLRIMTIQNQAAIKKQDTLENQMTPRGNKRPVRMGTQIVAPKLRPRPNVVRPVLIPAWS